ncbi:MAG TPA: hypothetical protein DIW80_03860 [Gordonia polyisoprenivorans]|uniref:hypothetical protein n=1 Tax=Gordonia polyisoprenivorans TaxID=84595 RepID=UPI000ED72116|nr:hypothetical protein LH935_16370 [Gordonia polyisoprenivorans]HCS56512.1 hypothetical protein [Gordonia polyisoprenivorans]
MSGWFVDSEDFLDGLMLPTRVAYDPDPVEGVRAVGKFWADTISAPLAFIPGLARGGVVPAARPTHHRPKPTAASAIARQAQAANDPTLIEMLVRQGRAHWGDRESCKACGGKRR